MKIKRTASELLPVLRKGKSWVYNKAHYVFITFFTFVLLAFTIWLIALFS